MSSCLFHGHSAAGIFRHDSLLFSFLNADSEGCIKDVAASMIRAGFGISILPPLLEPFGRRNGRDHGNRPAGRDRSIVPGAAPFAAAETIRVNTGSARGGVRTRGLDDVPEYTECRPNGY